MCNSFFTTARIERSLTNIWPWLHSQEFNRLLAPTIRGIHVDRLLLRCQTIRLHRFRGSDLKELEDWIYSVVVVRGSGKNKEPDELKFGAYGREVSFGTRTALKLIGQLGKGSDGSAARTILDMSIRASRKGTGNGCRTPNRNFRSARRD